MQKVMLKVKVNPRSSKNQITGWKDNVLSVKLSAPPVDGAANKACIEFLADKLHLKKSQISLSSGASSRDKLFEIDGISRDELNERLESI